MDKELFDRILNEAHHRGIKATSFHGSVPVGSYTDSLTGDMPNSDTGYAWITVTDTAVGRLMCDRGIASQGSNGSYVAYINRYRLNYRRRADYTYAVAAALTEQGITATADIVDC